MCPWNAYARTTARATPPHKTKVEEDISYKCRNKPSNPRSVVRNDLITHITHNQEQRNGPSSQPAPVILGPSMGILRIAIGTFHVTHLTVTGLQCFRSIRSLIRQAINNRIRKPRTHYRHLKRQHLPILRKGEHVLALPIVRHKNLREPIAR